MASFSDSFDRANGAPANGWVIGIGSFAINTNQLQITSTNAASFIIQGTSVMASADHFAQFKITGGLLGTFGVAARVSSNGDSFYVFRRKTATTVSIVKVVSNGSLTAVGPDATYSVAVNDVLRIECQGSTIRGIVNGATLLTVTDTSIPSGFGVGFRSTSSNNGMLIDDFSAGDISVADTTSPTVSVTAPVASSTISGVTTLTATATDNVAVTSVRFYAEAVDLGAATNTSGSTWSLSYDTAGLSNGSHAFTAVATDAALNATTSATVNATVSNAAVLSGPTYWDGTTELQLTTENLSYWDGTTEQVFGVGRQLSYWDGSTETVLLGSVPPPSGSGMLTQATMPSSAAAWTLYAEPTTTTISASALTGTLYTPTDSLFEYTGVTGIVAAATAGYYRAPYQADIGTAGTGTNPSFHPSYGIRFKTDAPTIEVKLQQRPDIAGKTGIKQAMAVRIKVNGQWTSRTPTYLGLTTTGYSNISTSTGPEPIAPGTEVWVSVDFGSVAVRSIEFVTMGEFGGVRLPDGYSLVAADAPVHCAVVLGDSLSGAENHGTGNFDHTGKHTGTYSQVSSFWPYLCQTIGYDDVKISASGGSGFTRAGDSVDYETAARLNNDVIALNPELIVVGTAFNDLSNGVSVAAVQTAATNIVTALQTGCPDALIILFGCPNAPALGAGAAATVAPYNQALRDVGLAKSVWVIDPSVGNLYSPTGSIEYSDGDLLAGRSAYVSNDQVHPTQEGADLIGTLLAEYVRYAHPVS